MGEKDLSNDNLAPPPETDSLGYIITNRWEGVRNGKFPVP